MIRGSCCCGAISFALSEPPSMMGVCHCTRCRKVGARLSGGSAGRIWFNALKRSRHTNMIAVFALAAAPRLVSPGPATVSPSMPTASMMTPKFRSGSTNSSPKCRHGKGSAMRRLSSRAIRSKVQRKWVSMRDDSYLFPIIFLRRKIDVARWILFRSASF